MLEVNIIYVNWMVTPFTNNSVSSRIPLFE